ncbi:MAG TPA: GNAT family N-acetyltransferase [Acidimicrobiia bacterium]|nr:GNAT family N-acetyltransferase [Acidimicrobiia bacterium]
MLSTIDENPNSMDRTEFDQVAVVEVGQEDWQRVRRLRLAALADAPDAFWATLEEESNLTEAEWRHRLTDASRATFIAVRGPDPGARDVGLAMTGPSRLPDAAGLYGLWVDPRYRGQGIADELVAAVVGHATAAGYGRLLLDVGDHNRTAIAFYGRMGFRPTGRTNAFPPPRDHITEHELALVLDGSRPV